MKRIYNILLFLLAIHGAWAQSTNQNYVQTRTYTKNDASTYIDQIQYFDGLGRLVQTVQKGITPTGKDLVNLVQYDALGRDFKKWLPAPATAASGNYVDSTAFFALANAQYTSAEKPYTLTGYEPSPLSRVTGQYGAGSAWYTNNKKVATAYQTNAANEVAYYYVNSSDKLQRARYYDPATLYKTEVTDEDGKPATEYKDKLGQVVMKQNSTDVRTYYVNDDLGRLRYVIPPAAADMLTADSVFNDSHNALVWYGYLYQYDERGNNTMKRLPGCDPIWMVYDKSDRLVLSQDGNQRKKKQADKKQWSVTKYDLLGRVLYTGITYIDSTKTLSVLCTEFKTQLVTEAFDGSTLFCNTGYTCTGSITAVQPLTVNYYDNYAFRKRQTAIDTTKLVYATPPPGFDAQYTNAKGLLTGSRTYILDQVGTNYTATAHYYDDRGRVVQSRSSNHLGGFDVVYNHYSFTSKVLQMRKEHNIAGTTPVPELYTYTYDPADRQKITTYQFGTQTAVTLSNMSFDELGRLQTNCRHNNADTLTYAYNIRNWPTMLKSSYRFTEMLYYNSAPVSQATPCYNGNIAYATWNYGSSKRAYIYKYDSFNRLTNADAYQPYGTSSLFGLGYNEAYTYDKMGNITNLQRKKGTISIDYLNFAYNGNQISFINDYSGSQNQYAVKEYNNRNSTGNDFAYDNNGNMTMDLDRDIVTIQYNILNLPDLIQFKNGNQIVNKYDASGRKLSEQFYTLVSPLVVPLLRGQTINLEGRWDLYDFVTGNAFVDDKEYYTERDNQDNFIDLDKIYNAEGYMHPAAGTSMYYYYRKDHTGDNREVWYANTNTTVQQTQYYASGLPWDVGTGASVQNRKYNGKEFIEMHGYDTYDYGARGYFAAVGRFTSVDPLAEKYYSVSPYVYCAGNPVNRIDPNGMDWYRDEKGNSFWREGDAKTITKNDIVYTNTGTTYTHQIDKNTSITYTQNEATSVTTNTMDKNEWVSQYDSRFGDEKQQAKACNKASDAMLANEDTKSGGMVVVVNNAGNGRAGTANNKAFNAIDNMSTALDFGKPTKVNVDYRAKSSSADGMGDHFIVVEGKTETLNNGQVTSTTFNFFDPGTHSRDKGTSPNNTLSIMNKTLVGSHINNGKPIVVTSIRPSR